MRERDGMGWIGLYRPSEDEIREVAEEFGDPRARRGGRPLRAPAREARALRRRAVHGAATGPLSRRPRRGRVRGGACAGRSRLRGDDPARGVPRPRPRPASPRSRPRAPLPRPRSRAVRHPRRGRRRVHARPRGARERHRRDREPAVRGEHRRHAAHLRSGSGGHRLPAGHAAAVRDAGGTASGGRTNTR